MKVSKLCSWLSKHASLQLVLFLTARVFYFFITFICNLFFWSFIKTVTNATSVQVHLRLLHRDYIYKKLSEIRRYNISSRPWHVFTSTGGTFIQLSDARRARIAGEHIKSSSSSSSPWYHIFILFCLLNQFNPIFTNSKVTDYKCITYFTVSNTRRDYLSCLIVTYSI